MILSSSLFSSLFSSPWILSSLAALSHSLPLPSFFSQSCCDSDSDSDPAFSGLRKLFSRSWSVLLISEEKLFIKSKGSSSGVHRSHEVSVHPRQKESSPAQPSPSFSVCRILIYWYSPPRTKSISFVWQSWQNCREPFSEMVPCAILLDQRTPPSRCRSSRLRSGTGSCAGETRKG